MISNASGPIAAPGIAFQTRQPLCGTQAATSGDLHRAQMDVPRDGRQIDVILNQLGLEAALKQVAGAVVLVAPVEGVGRRQSQHEAREVFTRRAAKEMDVVAHACKSVQIDATKTQVVGQLREESLAVVIAVEDVRSAVAAAGHMIDGVGRINSWRARHAYRLP